MPLKNYIDRLSNTLSKVDENKINLLHEWLIETIRKGGIIVLCGNGGSYSNASHISGDYQKTFAHYFPLINSIGDNFCSISAISNDLDYKNAMEILIKTYLKKEINTLIVFLSGSGNSVNIVKAAETLKEFKEKKYPLKTISISGYGGGKIKNITDLSISIDIKDMEISEDFQLILFHHLKQRLTSELKSSPMNSEKYNQRTNLNVIA